MILTIRWLIKEAEDGLLSCHCRKRRRKVWYVDTRSILFDPFTQKLTLGWTGKVSEKKTFPVSWITVVIFYRVWEYARYMGESEIADGEKQEWILQVIKGQSRSGRAMDGGRRRDTRGENENCAEI